MSFCKWTNSITDDVYAWCYQSNNRYHASRSEKIKIHTSYNLTAFSFSAKDLEENVRKYIPELKCTYAPDFRQKIADSRPASLDDSAAQKIGVGKLIMI